MGLTEVLAHLPRLLRLRRQLIRAVLDWQPDIFVGIDSPDFNLPIAGRLHRRGITTAHYVSPTVWAWRRGRVKGIRRDIDHMLTLLPFEARFYEDAGVPVTFVGHPMADRIPLETDASAARRELGLEDGPLVALLPGSRRGEVERLLPDFLAAAEILHRRHPELGFVLPAAGPDRHREIAAELERHPDVPVTLVEGQSRTAMAAADAVLLASGTATLEGLLLKKPMVVGYRVGRLTYAILSRLVKTEWVAMANLLLGEEQAPELIQDDFRPEAVAAALEYWLEHPDEAHRLAERYEAVHRQLRRDASRRAAETIEAVARDHG
jgi:lipid-A-disaccharide synthase